MKAGKKLGKIFLIISEFPIYLVKNFSVELYIESLKLFSKKDVKAKLNEFKTLLKNYLDSHSTKGFFIFYWEDGSPQKYLLDKLFGTELTNHENTDFLRINIRATEVRNILNKIKSLLKLNISSQIISNITDNFNGNLLKIQDYVMQLTNENADCHADINPKFFHLLGKFLYNKRYDNMGKIRGLTNKELETPGYGRMYFRHDELLDNMKESHDEFNEYLKENYAKHFKDVGEFAKAAETFSMTEKLGGFKYKRLDINNNLQSHRSLVNSMAVTVENKSQYTETKIKNLGRIDHKYKKPIDRVNDLDKIKRENKDLYIKLIKQMPYLIRHKSKSAMSEVNRIIARKTKIGFDNKVHQITLSQDITEEEGEELVTENINVVDDFEKPEPNAPYSHKILETLPSEERLIGNYVLENGELNDEALMAVMDTIEEDDNYDDYLPIAEDY